MVEPLDHHLKVYIEGYLMLYKSLKLHEVPLISLGSYRPLFNSVNIGVAINTEPLVLHLKLVIIVTQFHIKVTPIYYSETNYEP